jgi:hypothetical protein
MEGSFRSVREMVTWETPAFWARSRKVTRWANGGRASVVFLKRPFFTAKMIGPRILAPNLQDKQEEKSVARAHHQLSPNPSSRLSTPNAMERRSTFAATTVGKSFCPRPPVPSPRVSLDAAVDNTRFYALQHRAF